MSVGHSHAPRQAKPRCIAPASAVVVGRGRSWSHRFLLQRLKERLAQIASGRRGSFVEREDFCNTKRLTWDPPSISNLVTSPSFHSTISRTKHLTIQTLSTQSYLTVHPLATPISADRTYQQVAVAICGAELSNPLFRGQPCTR